MFLWGNWKPMISTRHTMIKYFSYSAGQWWDTTFNPALGKQTKAVMRPAWSSQQDPRQPGLYRETLSQHTKRTSYSTFKRKRHLMSKQPGIRLTKWMEKALLNLSVLITTKKASLIYSLNHLMPLALHGRVYCYFKDTPSVYYIVNHILGRNIIYSRKLFGIALFFLTFIQVYNTHWVYFSPGPYLTFSHPDSF